MRDKDRTAIEGRRESKMMIEDGGDDLGDELMRRRERRVSCRMDFVDLGILFDFEI